MKLCRGILMQQLLEDNIGMQSAAVLITMPLTMMQARPQPKATFDVQQEPQFPRITNCLGEIPTWGSSYLPEPDFLEYLLFAGQWKASWRPGKSVGTPWYNLAPSSLSDALPEARCCLGRRIRGPRSHELPLHASAPKEAGRTRRSQEDSCSSPSLMWRQD